LVSLINSSFFLPYAQRLFRTGGNTCTTLITHKGFVPFRRNEYPVTYLRTFTTAVAYLIIHPYSFLVMYNGILGTCFDTDRFPALNADKILEFDHIPPVYPYSASCTVQYAFLCDGAYGFADSTTGTERSINMQILQFQSQSSISNLLIVESRGKPSFDHPLYS